MDTTKPEWYEKTPTLDIRSKEYIESRFKIKIQPGQWVTVLEASRRNELDVDKAHGYSLIYQPIGQNKYRAYSFGAFPLTFPQNTRELATFIGNTVKGTIAFDPNYFYSNRQKASWPKAVDENVAKALLEEIGTYRNLGIAFQFGWDNCAHFIRNLFISVFEKMHVEIKVPNFFEKKFVKIKPLNPALRAIQKVFKKTPKELMPLLKLAFIVIFGATRSVTVIENGKKIKKSLSKSPFFSRNKINAPSAMHYRIKKERLKKAVDPALKEKFADCVLNYGHTHSIASPAA